MDESGAPLVASAGFKAWLYRPYIDLGPGGAAGNVHVTGVSFALKAMVEDRPYPRIHGLLNPSLRRAMVREARMGQHALDDPLDLPEELWTPGWTALCDRLRHFAEIEPEDQLRVLFLLHRICLHTAILKYAPVPTDEQVRRSEPHAGILYLRGLSNLAFANDRTAGLDTSDLERVATLAPAGGWARVEGTYSLCSAAAKLRHDPEQLRHWLGEHRQQIDLADADEHTRNKLMSRFHRIYAFVPQFDRDWVGMSAEMDLAERYAYAMRCDTPETLAEWTALGLAMRESRTKEALVLGDLDRAEMWARRSVEHCSADPRGWLELGQVLIEREKIAEALAAYRKAVRFGPAGTEIAWFMAGQCCEALGEPEAAADAYLSALDVDPLAISAAQRLEELAPGLGSADLATWAKAKSERLEAMAATPAMPKVEEQRPYQQYDGVLGRG